MSIFDDTLVGKGINALMPGKVHPDTQFYTDAKKQYQPFISGGTSAENQLLLQLGLGGTGAKFDVTNLPGYQQALSQGISATNQGLASQGLIGSGNQMRALQTAGQNVFGSYYQNYMNELGGQASMGSNDIGNLANVGATAAGMTNQANMFNSQMKAQMMNDVLGAAGTLGGMAAGMPMGGGGGGGQLDASSFSGGMPQYTGPTTNIQSTGVQWANAPLTSMYGGSGVPFSTATPQQTPFTNYML